MTRMRRAALLACLSALLILGLTVSGLTQAPGRAYSSGCGAVDNGSAPRPTDNHVVFWSSEGTAWPTFHVYVTAFNPTSRSQHVVFRVIPDGAAEIVREVDVAPRTRYPLYVNDLVAAAGLGGRVNFATEIQFETIGAASMATWDLDYTRVTYATMVQGCESAGWHNPYGL